MNNINFNQTGGFPLSTNMLDAMQEAYKLFGELGEAIGKNCIVSGCEINGANVADGVVVLNGEILPFKGSGRFVGAVVTVQEEVEERIFEDANSKPVIYKRYAKLSTGFGFAFDSMMRIKPIIELTKAIVPVGLISMWSGTITAIPKGWVLCDGQNSTPDLRNRFIVGAGNQYNVSETGGENEVKLTESQMPSHTHGIIDPGHDHSFTEQIDGKGNNWVFLNGPYNSTTSIKTSWEKTNITIKASGGNQVHENRPPYFALAFIMFKG
ncbi:hypothetical protein [Myroides odoratus]|uniref:hypothetical protein n=1 Tax=Myroides odoratus TaxID=256 RepID=UPI0039AF62F1